MTEQQIKQQPELCPESSIVDQLLIVLNLWLKRLGALQELAIAETQLNIRVLAAITGLVVAMVLVSISLWVSALAAIGMIAYWLTKSLLLAVVIVIVFQCLMLWWLLVNIRQVQTKLGYRRTTDALRALVQPVPANTDAVREQSNAG